MAATAFFCENLFQPRILQASEKGGHSWDTNFWTPVAVRKLKMLFLPDAKEFRLATTGNDRPSQSRSERTNSSGFTLAESEKRRDIRRRMGEGGTHGASHPHRNADALPRERPRFKPHSLYEAAALIHTSCLRRCQPKVGDGGREDTE